MRRFLLLWNYTWSIFFLKKTPRKKHVSMVLPLGSNKSLGFKSETVNYKDPDNAYSLLF